MDILLVVFALAVGLFLFFSAKEKPKLVLDWQALGDAAWDKFAEKEGEYNKRACLKQIMVDKSKNIHYKKDYVIEECLVDYFVDKEIVYASFIRPDNFKIEQFKYPEPVLLKLTIPEKLEEKSSGYFTGEACQEWGRLNFFANGWARLDQKSNRVLIDIDSVALRDSYIIPDICIGFYVKGIVFDEVMEEGIPTDGSNNWRLKSGAKMAVQFERAEELNEM